MLPGNIRPTNKQKRSFFISYALLLEFKFYIIAFSTSNSVHHPIILISPKAPNVTSGILDRNTHIAILVGLCVRDSVYIECI